MRTWKPHGKKQHTRSPCLNYDVLADFCHRNLNLIWTIRSADYNVIWSELGYIFICRGWGEQHSAHSISVGVNKALGLDTCSPLILLSPRHMPQMLLLYPYTLAFLSSWSPAYLVFCLRTFTSVQLALEPLLPFFLGLGETLVFNEYTCISSHSPFCT